MARICSDNGADKCDPLDFACPICKVPPGFPCEFSQLGRTPREFYREFDGQTHIARIKRAVRGRGRTPEIDANTRSHAASLMGSIRSQAKARASRENGKKGGRPKKATGTRKGARQ